MRKQIPLPILGRPDRTPFGRAVFKTCMSVTLMGMWLLTSLAEGQTYRQRTYQRASRATTATARQGTSLASYVSDYAGEQQTAPSPGPTPAAQMPASSSKPMVQGTAPPAPSGGYEVIEPGLPVGTTTVPGDLAGGPIVEGDCDTCGPMGGCCEGMPCWGPGDCFGGDCYPFLRPLRDRVWVQADYLLWWLNSYSVPPLVTTSTNAEDAGILLRPTTSIVFGNQHLNSDNRSGVRIALGSWLDPCQTAAWEVIYTHISEDTSRFNSGATINSVLARPFFDSGDGVQSSWLLAVPGQLQGWVDVRASNQFHTLEALTRRQLFQTCTTRTDMVLGYRYADLRDELTISDHRLRSAGAPDPVGTQIDQSDWFDTTNTFHGAEIGFTSKTRYLRWSIDLLMKLAMGNTRSKAAIDGQTVTRLNGSETIVHAGLLTQATNIGTIQHNSFTVIPELGLTIGYDITARLRGTVGYNFLYWSKVVRAGDQVDFNVNLPAVDGELPIGAQQPAAPFKTRDFWAQGLSFGLEYQF